MSLIFGRALRTKAAFQTAIDTYSAGDWYALKTYKRGDPATPDLSDDPVLGLDSDNNRDPIAPLVGMQKGDAQRTVPLALAEVGMWLSACFGYPTTTGEADPYTHVFKSGAEALPYLTVQDMLASAQFRYHRGVIVDGFSIQATKENAYPQMVLDLLMRDAAFGTDWLDGDDAAAFSFQRPTAWTANVLWADTAIGVASTCTLNYKNNADRSLLLSGDEFPVSIDPMLATVGGSFKLRTTSDTYHTLAKNGGAAAKLSLVWKLASAPTTRSIQVDFNLVRLTSSGQPVEGAGELTADFTIRGEQGASGTPAVTVTLKNDVDTYTPA
jgi:hypothetical protein